VPYTGGKSASEGEIGRRKGRLFKKGLLSAPSEGGLTSSGRSESSQGG